MNFIVSRARSARAFLKCVVSRTRLYKNGTGELLSNVVIESVGAIDSTIRSLRQRTLYNALRNDGRNKRAVGVPIWL